MTREERVGTVIAFLVVTGASNWWTYGLGRAAARPQPVAPAPFVEPAQESACEKKFTQLFNGHCRELQCQRIWDEKSLGSSDSNLKERYPTTVDGTAPIGCPMKNEVPWVRSAEFNRVEFMCLPAELTQ